MLLGTCLRWWRVIKQLGGEVDASGEETMVVS